MICNRCGHTNDNSSKFCAVCGSPLNQNPSATVVIKSKGNTPNFLAIIFSLISVLCNGIVLIYNCLEVNGLLRNYGTYVFEGTNILTFFNQYFAWAIIGILTAFCLVFSKKDSKSIPLVIGIDAIEGLITFTYGVFIYGSTEFIDIIGLFVNLVICGAALVWLIKPHKSWISSIMIIFTSVFYVYYRIQLIEFDTFEVLRILGLLFVDAGIVLKGFSSSEPSGKIKQIDTPIFWIVIAALTLLSLVGFFARFA